MRRAVTALCLAALSACGAGGGEGGTQPPPATLSLAIGTSALTIAQGASATSAITVGRTNFAGTVALSGGTPPNGVTVSFAPASLTAGATSAVATVAVGPSTAPGTYALAVTASGSGVSSASGVMTLTVPSPSFTLQASAPTASIVQGANTTLAFSIVRGGGFGDAVNLAVSGLPTGVTASFAPASIASGATTSTLTLTAALNASVGTAPITITGSGTGVTAQTVSVGLTIIAAPTPAITLTAGAATANVVQGAGATVALTITRAGGFSEAVSLAVAGVPTGVTAALAPASIPSGATTSTLTLSAAANATVGTTPIIITASGVGVAAQTATITVTVSAGATLSISLSASPAALSVQAGTNGTSTIALTRTGGSASDVALAVTGAPTGVTATLSPSILAGAATGSTLTLASLSSVVPGQYTLTVTGSATGIASASTSVVLTVTAVPSVALSVAPTALSVVPGGSVTSTVTLVRVNFAGDIALAATGLPAGVTATFAPTALTGSIATLVLTLTAPVGAALGTSTVTLVASGTGVTSATATLGLTISAAPAIALTAAPTIVSFAAGGTATSVITLARTNVTTDVALAASNLPTGVTAAFAPATLTGTTLTSTLTLSAAASAPLVTQTVTVTASATGVPPAIATIGATVSAAPGYALGATAATATQGGVGTSTVTITRSGGYSGAVTLAAGTLPNGVTATISPNPATTNSATITFTAAANATTGLANITITGSGAGLTGSVTTTVPLTVTAGGGGGTVVWTFCAADRFPAWFAVQNGSGAWTTVSPSGAGTATRVYTFAIGAVGGVAYAIPRTGGGTDITVQYGTGAEFPISGAQECPVNRPRQTLTGSVAGLMTSNPLAAQTASIFVGDANGFVATNGPFTLAGAPAGLSDLLAIRSTPSIDVAGVAQTPDRLVLRRSVNYASTIPLIDFGDEGFAPASATYTVANLSGEPVVTASTIFATANGNLGSVATQNVAGGAAITVFGVPNANLLGGDQHQVLVSAYSGTGGSFSSGRLLYQVNNQLASRTITLGAVAPPLTPTSLGTAPYARFTAAGTWPIDYPDAIGLTYTQRSGAGNSWSLSLSRGYAGTGTTNWSLAIPDFSGVLGFQTSWGLGSTIAQWSFTASGNIGRVNPSTGQFGEGVAYRAAIRTGTVTP
jgi:uncharacterized membrane protein